MGKKKKATPKTQRTYAGAIRSRLTTDWITQSTSADSEVWGSLRTLRDRSRSLCRDNDYAIHAVRTIVSNVVGDAGIRLQSKVLRQRGKRLNDPLNTEIEKKWKRWGKRQHCDVAGKLGWLQIEQLAFKSIIESGEVLIRIVPYEFGGSGIPLALQVIESDQLADDYSLSLRPLNGNVVKMGIEQDQWGKAQAYWVYPTHPGDNLIYDQRNRSQPIRIPAEEILHLYVCDRPGQSRGVPWLAAAINKLRNLWGYEEAEIIKARVEACKMGFIQTTDTGMLGDRVEPAPAPRQLSMEAGTILELQPNETFQGFAPTSQGQTLEPFLKFLIRSVASGMGIGYEELSKDYSQTSYGSQRASMLESRSIYRVMQTWLSTELHQRVYERWIDAANFSLALNLPGYEINPEFYDSPKWMPRGWDWIDPLKDANASIRSVQAGLSTLGRELANQGVDLEDLAKERDREIELLKSMGLQVAVYAETMPLPEAKPPKSDVPVA